MKRIAIQTSKIPHILKGTLTWVPVFNSWRLRRASTGGSDSPRYCYSTWLRHLVSLNTYGFRISDMRVGELGPGDSIGIGLVALLSGAAQYIGLDIVPFSANANLEEIFSELAHLYSRREAIPGNDEFPRLRPRLDSYEFPRHLVDETDCRARADRIRKELRAGLNGSELLKYHAPWTSPNDIPLGSLDLIFSQAVLEHVDNLEETYQAMFAWLKPGGYASHVIDFSAHYLSPYWNGHWAYSDLQWKLVRGRREYLLNRQPLSMHVCSAKQAGFEVLGLHMDYGKGGLNVSALSKRFRKLDTEDLRTRGVALILRRL